MKQLQLHEEKSDLGNVQYFFCISYFAAFVERFCRLRGNLFFYFKGKDAVSFQFLKVESWCKATCLPSQKPIRRKRQAI